MRKLIILAILTLAGISCPGQNQPTAPGKSKPQIRVGPIEIYERVHDRQDLTYVGHDAIIEEGETFHDVVVVLGDLEINGTVSGDLVVVLGNLKAGPTAQISREVVLIGGRIEAHPDAKLRGMSGPRITLPPFFFLGIRDWVKQGVLWGRPLPHHPGFAWWFAAAFAGLYLLTALGFPSQTTICGKELASRPATTFVVGLLVLLLLGPLIILLLVSVVGIVLVPFLKGAVLLALILGKTALLTCLGQRLLPPGKDRSTQSLVFMLLPGLAVLYLLYMVPVLGMILLGFTEAMALGAVTLAAVGALRSESSDQSQTVPAPIPKPDATQEGALSQTLLPRAGFWVRLTATALDFVLVGAIAAIFQSHAGGIFPALWLLYHLGLWSWKGTTIGGIVVGLQIVRLNGEPLRFSVALVRCLSAVFSALVLFVGFFWAGWDRQKQSWHDIIAGTVIVRVPKGASLI